LDANRFVRHLFASVARIIALISDKNLFNLLKYKAIAIMRIADKKAASWLDEG
jgi:hypothetical protein